MTGRSILCLGYRGRAALTGYSAPEHEDVESARFDSSAFALRHGQENLMRLRVERHGLGSALGGDFVDFRITVGRVLMEDVHRAIAVREKDELGGGLEIAGVDVIADRHG